MTSGFGAQLEAHHRALVAEIVATECIISERTQHLRQLQLKLESVLELMKIEGVGDAESHRHFLEVAHDALLQSGPQHYVALAAALRAKGVLIPGAKPEANLLAHMSRDERFKKTGRGVYAISAPARPRNGNGKSAHFIAEEAKTGRARRT